MIRATVYLHQQAPRNPDLPALRPVWDRPRRVAWMGEANPNWRTGRYTAVRRKVELHVHRACLFFGALQPHRILALVRDAHRPELEEVYRHVAALGPERGWGLPDERRPGPRSSKWTRYVVTRAGMAHARAFLYWCGRLRALYSRALALISRVITPYPTGSKERQRQEENSAHQGDLAAVLTRLLAKHGPAEAPAVG